MLMRGRPLTSSKISCDGLKPIDDLDAVTDVCEQ